MSGIARIHIVDGAPTTVSETAARLGLDPQQIYAQMHHRRCSLQAVVNLYRDGMILDGDRGDHYMVDGKWMTTRQAADMLGVPYERLYRWRTRNRTPDGKVAPLAEAVRAYQEGRVRWGGSEPKVYKVHDRRTTLAEAAERAGVSRNALQLYMNRHKVSLETALRHAEVLKRKRAKRAILRALGFEV